jgi:hypothetical protein
MTFKLPTHRHTNPGGSLQTVAAPGTPKPPLVPTRAVIPEPMKESAEERGVLPEFVKVAFEGPFQHWTEYISSTIADTVRVPGTHPRTPPYK